MAEASLEAVELGALESPESFEEIEEIEDEAIVSSSSVLLRNETMAYEQPEKTVGPFYLICLTIGIGGLQVIWTAIMSQGSPYLLSLNVPTHLVSLVWLAGPLCGAIVQPYIGILSDRCEHPLGRRRPFIIAGTIATIICMLGLPWTTDIITFLFGLGGYDPCGNVAIIIKGLAAIAWVWALNVSIQPVQGGLRSIIVDCCPPKQQVEASAYASCATCVGSIIGYASGYLAIPRYMPWFGDTQLKGLDLVASILLGSTVAITCIVAKEKQYIGDDVSRKSGILATFKEVYKRARTMPKAIRKVCLVQFFAWLGWFPFLFYITTYIGQIYEIENLPIEKHSNIDTHTTPRTAISPTAHSIRHAAFAMILFSVISLAANLILPLLVSKTPIPKDSKINEKPSFSIFRWKLSLPFPWLTLSRAWMASHILYSVVILLTVLADDTYALTVALTSLLGISWAVTQWIPIALISTEIAKSNSIFQPTSYIPLRDNEENVPDTPSYEEHERESQHEALQAGAIMGVYNMAIATPQILAAVQGSGVFWLLGREGIVGGEAAGWVIRTGTVAAGIAAWLASRIN